MFAEIVKRWHEGVVQRFDLAQSTKVEYARIAGHLQAWADTQGNGLDLRPYVEQRRAADAAPRTIALELRVASIAFHWARETGIVPRSAVLSVPRLRIDPKRFVLNHRTPTLEEATAVIAAMPQDDWRLAALLLGRTGARLGEVMRLRSIDFDERDGRLALGAVDGASKSGLRWFPLDPATRRDLAGRSGRGEEPLLDLDAYVAPEHVLQRRIQQACERACVPRFTPHGLRRMVVGRLLRAGVDPGTAASLTGHSVEVMLKYYQQVTDEDRRAAVEKANLGILIDDRTP